MLSEVEWLLVSKKAKYEGKANVITYASIKLINTLSQRALSILDSIKQTLERGYASRALQRNPHIVLLNPEFYHTELKPLMAQWLLLFLESQHVSGLTEEQLSTYILHGATNLPELAHRVNHGLTAKYPITSLAQMFFAHVHHNVFFVVTGKC